MKKAFLWGLPVLCMLTPLVTMGAPDGWGAGHVKYSGEWISQVTCDKIISKIQCDYTGPAKSLRVGYRYLFADEFWAGNQERRMKNACVSFEEPELSGDYNAGDNPKFGRTSQLSENKYRIPANGHLIVLNADRNYEILKVPSVRSRDNLWIKYVIEYANNEEATTRYHHTECFPYEISRCGDGIVDTDRFMKEKDDPGEECDPADPRWKDNKACDPVTCQGITPVCRSSLNGETVGQLDPSDYLCEIGTMTDFNYDESTHTWTWKCDNVAGTSTDCSAKKSYDGNFVVEKTLVSKTQYISKIGEELVWEIKVTAVSGDVKNVEIKDELPDVLAYSGYSSNLPSGVTIAKNQPTFSNDKKVIYWKTNGTLKSGDSIVLTVVTVATAMPKPTDEYKNVACAKAEGLDEQCQPVPIGGQPNLWIEKYFSNLDGTEETKEIKTVKIGEEVVYKIKFGNNGNAEVVASIKDMLPKNLILDHIFGGIYINGKKINTDTTQNEDGPRKGFPESDEGVEQIMYGSITLKPGDEGYIILRGEVSSKNQKSSTQNFACIYWDDSRACDRVQYKIEDVMCEKITVKTHTFDYKGGSTKITCETDGGEAEISIDCGNGTKYTEKGRLSLTKTCEYDRNKGSRSQVYDVECKVNGVSKKSCQETVTVEPKEQEDPTCEINDPKNGEIKCTSNRPAHITLYCDGKKVDEIRGKTLSYDGYDQCKELVCDVDGKESCSWSNTNEGSQECFNVNGGNFSIEEGEIFPFYRNLVNMEEVVGNDINYTTINGKYGEAPQNFDKYGNGKYDCEDGGAIAKDTMLCTFEIHENKKEESLYTIKGPCLRDDKDKPGDPLRKISLLNAWYRAMIGEHCTPNNNDCYFSYNANRSDGRTLLSSAVYYIEKFGSGATLSLSLNGLPGDRSLEYNKTKEAKKDYGEYRIILENVEYLQCDGGKWVKKDAKKSENGFVPCTHNFVLTNPYTVQKTPSGNLTASTEELEKYRTMDKDKLKFSEYIDGMSATGYSANTGVKKAMDEFISKYQKLAVNVNVTKSTFLSKNNGTTISKVPGKSIYFVDGDLTISGTGNIEAPFTIVQTKGSTTIEGNVKYNMMLLTKNDITFKGSCTDDQTVKGIFYASGDLIRKLTTGKNNKTDHNYWCTKGALHVKGVLIGNNFTDLMNKSRSHLYDWFNETNKKKAIMNGASVLIEYSPSVFSKSTMPPGAEDFTTALSIYKN